MNLHQLKQMNENQLRHYLLALASYYDSHIPQGVEYMEVEDLQLWAITIETELYETHGAEEVDKVSKQIAHKCSIEVNKL